MPRLHRLAIGVSAVLALTLAALRPQVAAQTGPSLPDRLSDREFWALTEQVSEPGGTFQSDNLVSNETGFQKVLPALTDRHPAGGVYLGVGPEQNFTYIAALRPRVAFIVDVRRGNRDLHMMYKAIFELARNRAEFVSLLFSRERPAGLSATSTVAEIFAALEASDATEERFRANLARITGVLTKQHRLPLSEDELRGIEYVYDVFFRFGPEITYSSSRWRPNSNAPFAVNPFLRGTYAALMLATDANDETRGYLSSEERFSVVKDLHAKNLLVPVVGNFAGPKAVRAVGDWLRSRRAVVSAFYLSNVEDYLRRDGLWDAFCRNVATLPTDEASDFIRSGGRGRPPNPAPAPDPSGAPTPRGFAFRSGSLAGSDTVVVMFSDGTSRQMTRDEAAKVMPAMMPGGGNRLGSIAEEIRPCRSGAW